MRQVNNKILMVSNSHDPNSWTLDSICVVHATLCKELFDFLKVFDGGEVLLGDYTSLKVKGIGSVPLKMLDKK